MSILSIIALVFAVVLLALIAFNVAISQKVVNIFFLLLIIIVICSNAGLKISG